MCSNIFLSRQIKKNTRMPNHTTYITDDYRNALYVNETLYLLIALSLSEILSMVTTCYTPTGPVCFGFCRLCYFSPSDQSSVWILPVISLLLTMEEPREQCIVVFALFVPDPTSECVCVCVCVCVEGAGGVEQGMLHPLPFH
jgi:hypothetical protein